MYIYGSDIQEKDLYQHWWNSLSCAFQIGWDASLDMAGISSWVVRAWTT
jgi:hypothetical protein